MNYKMPGNPIFRGAGTTENGQFELQFIVPKDITYGGQSGKISIYFEGDSYDGAGYQDSLIVDGTATDLIDTKGPEIEFEPSGDDEKDIRDLTQRCSDFIESYIRVKPQFWIWGHKRWKRDKGHR